MDPSFWWTCLLIIGLLAMSAFFSGSETALTAVNRATLHRLAAQGDRLSALLVAIASGADLRSVLADQHAEGDGASHWIYNDLDQAIAAVKAQFAG